MSKALHEYTDDEILEEFCKRNFAAWAYSFTDAEEYVSEMSDGDRSLTPEQWEEVVSRFDKQAEYVANAMYETLTDLLDEVVTKESN